MVSISCIIVSYNNGKFIKEAIMSVVNQTMPVNEIIVADDGSTDGSRAIISSLSRQYPQIRPIFRENNLGAAANRDSAIRVANGDLITTLDGDDFYLPEKIEKEFMAIENSSSSIAYSDIRKVNNEQENIGYVDTSAFSHFDCKQRIKWLAKRLGSIPRDMLLSKKLYLEIDGMNHQIPVYHDWDMKIRLAAYPTKWAYSGVEGIAYRQTGSGLSTMSSTKHIRDQWEVLWLNRQLVTKHIGQWSFGEALMRVLYRHKRGLIENTPLWKVLRKAGLSLAEAK